MGSTFGTVVEYGPWPGVYKLSFKTRNGLSGIGTVSNYGAGPFSFTNWLYDGGTNITSCDIVVGTPWAKDNILWLLWADADNTGITDVHLMRPLKDGSGWHAIGTALSDYIIDRLRWFTTIRPMQTIGGGGLTAGTFTNWASRNRPCGPQNRGGTAGEWGGMAIENIVAMANQSQKNLWINVPFRATDEYILKMAQTIRYGSDGVNPYTSDQGSPVFPPLDPGLKLYVEHGNEIWNSGSSYPQNENETYAYVKPWASGTTYKYGWSSDTRRPRVTVGTHVYFLTGVEGTHWAAYDEWWGNDSLVASVQPTNLTPGLSVRGADGLWWAYYKETSAVETWEADGLVENTAYNQGECGWRRTGYLAVRHSLIFRSVFGDAAMMTRVRPVLATQHGYQATTSHPLAYINALWGPSSSNTTICGYTNPKQPVNYYLYALATAPYFPNGLETMSTASAAALLTDTLYQLDYTHAPGNAADETYPSMTWNAAIAATNGLKYFAYEGGSNHIPELFNTFKAAEAANNTTEMNRIIQVCIDANYSPTLGAQIGANVIGGVPAADQTGYCYGQHFKEWVARGGELYMHFTLGEASGRGSTFGLGPPTTQSASDPRVETGPKWAAIKAFAAQVAVTTYNSLAASAYVTGRVSRSLAGRAVISTSPVSHLTTAAVIVSQPTRPLTVQAVIRDISMNVGMTTNGYVSMLPVDGPANVIWEQDVVLSASPVQIASPYLPNRYWVRIVNPHPTKRVLVSKNSSDLSSGDSIAPDFGVWEDPTGDDVVLWARTEDGSSATIRVKQYAR
jgi:hypothetical protein